MFSTYLQLGFDHISDLNGYDHILFIIALCAIYRLKDWRQILILVTAFTIGHSVTLALAALKIVQIKTELIEFLIPVTILITCFYNILKKETLKTNIHWNYALALVFGLIHGVGFSNFFRALLGKEADITLPLLAFNIGLEIGQLVIVAVIFILNYIFIQLLNIKHREWNLFVSGAAAGIAFIMTTERIFF
jgi:hypothetical protein